MKPSTWVSLTLALTMFATALQIAGLVSPLWIWLKLNNTEVGVGLYYRVGCETTHGGNCGSAPALPFGYDSASTYDLAEWQAIVWLESIASCLAILLCIMMLVFKVGFGVWRKMGSLNLTMLVTTLLICATLAAGLIVYFVNHGKVITRSPDINSQSFPWSALMCFIAFFFFLPIAALIHFKCRKRHYLENAIPTSADSKLALNPSTKNQLMKRYFTPSPYREDRRQALSVYSFNDQSRLLGRDSNSSRGIQYSGFNNTSLKAIEYKTNHKVSEEIDYNYVPVISTATLAAGITSGESVTRSSYIHGSVSNGHVSNGHEPHAHVSSGDVGTRVVERTYTTVTTGESPSSVEYRQNPEAEQYRRTQENQHRQWEILQLEAIERRRLQEERTLAGRETILRPNMHDTFSDVDSQARTIFYTGKDRRSVATDDIYTTVIKTGDSSRSWSGDHQAVVTTRVLPPTPPTSQPPEPHVYREKVTVLESGGQLRPPGNFRIPADHSVEEGIHQEVSTVHIRPKTHSKLVMASGHLTGDRFKYNGTYIYRPYSEDEY